MASKRGRKGKTRNKTRNDDVITKGEDQDGNSTISQEAQILQAHAVIQRLQTKYKHKLPETKENESSPIIQVVQSDLKLDTCGSPTKVQKVGQSDLELDTYSSPTKVQKVGENDPRLLNEISCNERCTEDNQFCGIMESKQEISNEDTTILPESYSRRTRSRQLFPHPKTSGRRKLRNCTQKSSQTKEVGKNDHFATLTESMTINETPSCRFSVPLDTPDIELPPAHQSTPMSTNKEQNDSVFVDDDPSHLSPSPPATDSYIFDSPSQSPHRKDTNKKSYHRLLQIRTPALEVKKRPPKRKPKVIKSDEADNWAIEINRQFAEIEDHELIVL